MKKTSVNCKALLDNFNVKDFHEKLFSWWEDHKRVYPWRFEKDPYKVLIAEIFLHRTNSSQVEKIYKDFVKKFPEIKSLLKAKKDEILPLLQSLGLKWRQELFNKMILTLREKYGGNIPLNYKELKSLPGIGNYIAAAVIIFTLNTPLPLLDSNIVRVTGRLFCLKITDSSRRSRLFHDYIYCLTYKNDPRIFYYALIDFAALVCKPQNPDCNKCPFENICCFYNRHREGNHGIN